jgi:uncharacterized protein YfaA (DUF2138 family)
VLVFECDGLLDLAKFCLNPWVVFVSMSVKLSKHLEALLAVAVVDKPTRRLSEVQLVLQTLVIRGRLCGQESLLRGTAE